MICERGEPDNDEVRRYRLRQNKYPSCPLKFHICQSDTKAIGRHQTHHCSIVLLSVLGQQHPVLLLGCVPRPLPSPKYICFCGLRWSECRFCFFITDKSKDFVHFRFLDFLWYRRIRQGFCYLGNPQSSCAGSNFQMACNTSQITSVHIPFLRLFARAFRVAWLCICDCSAYSGIFVSLLLFDLLYFVPYLIANMVIFSFLYFSPSF